MRQQVPQNKQEEVSKNKFQEDNKDASTSTRR